MYIKIFTVGGTIDKEYFDQISEYEVGKPFAQEILSELNLSFQYDVEMIMRKDSLDMTDSDRESVCDAVENCTYDHILITHGTDTIAQTAKALKRIKGKVVVLTGAMRPGKFHKTDAVFNIGFSLCSVQQLQEGVYVCMNGRVYKGDSIKKIHDEGRFEGESIPG